MSWRGDMLAVGFIGVLAATVLLVGAALVCWYSKSKHRWVTLTHTHTHTGYAGSFDAVCGTIVLGREKTCEKNIVIAVLHFISVNWGRRDLASCWRGLNCIH